MGLVVSDGSVAFYIMGHMYVVGLWGVQYDVRGGGGGSD